VLDEALLADGRYLRVLAVKPLDVAGAGRMAVLADPASAAFSVWQAREHRGARIVNEPGSVNFNVLNTRDPEAARRFYGAVFGWTTLREAERYTRTANRKALAGGVMRKLRSGT